MFIHRSVRPSQRQDPLRILLLSANPLNAEALRLDEEARTVEEVLARAKVISEVYYAAAVRPRDLPLKLQEVQPHYVHFSGHGKDGGIVLVNDEGLAYAVPQRALGSLFELVKGIKCVFLNCCYSYPQAEAIAQHVPFVIGTKTAISDKAAIEFSFGFYQAIGGGKKVPLAVKFGKNAMEMAGFSEESNTPVLISRAKIRNFKPDRPTGEDDEKTNLPLRPLSNDKERSVQLDDDLRLQHARGSSHETLSHLWNRIEQRREMLFIMGSESSCEGTKDGQAYPAFSTTIRRILADEGRDPENVEDLRKELRRVLRLWSNRSDDLEGFLYKYISGEPGPAHYYLAALALTLSPEYNCLLFLDTGFDDLMERALASIQRGSARTRCNVFNLPSNATENEASKIFENIAGSIQKGEPSIVKLFGSLGPDSPVLQRTVKFPEPILNSLQTCFQSPLLLIGCGSDDKTIGDITLRSPGHGPIFVIGEDSPLQRRDNLDVHHIKLPFGQFTLALMDLLRSRNRSLLVRVEGLLRSLEPRALYPNCATIAHRSEIASRPSLLRMEERLPRSESNGTVRALVPINRSETQPDLMDFLRGDRPLMAVIGESGTGKSTLFYQFYQNHGAYISVLYSVHELQSTRTLAGRLARDFLCEEHNLENLLAQLDQVLNYGDSHLLILVDGLNESADVRPATLRSELELLASRLPKRIKIAYSCRKVYWDNYIRPESEFPKKLYYGSKEILLGRFSEAEAEEAFRAYQNLYRFRGSYALLSAEFRYRITDPLMLRMLAEGYEERELPSFAPAVLIFEAYERRFREHFSGTYMPSFLKALIAHKVTEARGGHSSDQFEAMSIRLAPDLGKLVQLQLASPRLARDPLELLEDEGILSAIDEEKTSYRFAYDRFFEYLLGKALVTYQRSGGLDVFRVRLRRQVQELLPLHFSFAQALKSEIIRLNIMEPNGPWSMYNPEVVRSLLEDPDIAVSEFTKDLLRELMFEGREDLLSTISQVFTDPSANKLLMIDLAPDSARTLPLVVEALVSGSGDVARRCCRIIANFIAEPKHREIIEGCIAEMLRRESLTVQTASGLIYYTACIFEDADRKGEDPFPFAQDFWIRALKIAGHQACTTDIITNALVHAVREEGGRFFGETRYGAIEYFWKAITPQCRQLALRLIPLIKNPQMEIDQECREILLFFGSCIRDWSDRHKPSLATEFVYALEYRIAQWIFIQRISSRYQEVKEILQGFVDTGYTRSIEIALSNMRYACLLALRDKPALLKDAFETMKVWMEVFKQDEEGCYWALDTEDPYNLHECPPEPVGQIAILDEFTPRESPVEFLLSWFESADRRDRLFALLCARSLWPEAPAKILKTLEVVAHTFDSTMEMWLDRILKEIYLVHPRLVEDFFYRCQMDAGRIRSIKHRSDIVDPTGTSNDGSPLYKALFMGPQSRLEKVGEWYTKLHESPDLENFCRDLVHSLVRDYYT